MTNGLSDEMTERITDHEERMHTLIPPRQPLKAFPFRHDSIPGPVLERMLEVMETEGEDPHALAARFGYPPSLVLRELADHWANYQRHCKQRAQGW
jgi:hypothetical protein